MLSLFPIACLALTTAAGAPSAPPVAPMPAISSLLQAVVARDALTQQQLKSMQYDEHIQTDRLDAQGKVSQHQDLQLIVRPGANPELQVVSVHGQNLPTNPDDAVAQAKKQQAQRQQTFDLKSISARFNLTMQGRSNELGTDAYVIAFEPKANQPYHTQTEKVLNQLHGRIWIRASDNIILRTEASLLHPVQVAWVFASVTSLDFHYELPVGGSAYGPAWLETLVRVNAPLVTIAQRQRVDMTNFQPRTAKVVATNHT